MTHETRLFAVVPKNQSDDLRPCRLARQIHRVKCLSVVLGVSLFMWACGGDPTSLAGPTDPTFTVSGIVFEQTPVGTEAVADAWVQESNSHRGARTDKNGFYSLSGLSAGSISVTASASYYYVATITFLLSADIKKDIEMIEVIE